MDKARIDWLEKHSALLNVSMDGPHVCISDGRDGNYHVEAATYREVIDKAMREYVPYVNPEPEYHAGLTEIRFDSDCLINGIHIPAGSVWKRTDAAGGASPEEKQ